MAQPAVQVSFGPRFRPATAPVTFWLLVSVAAVWFIGVFSPTVPLALTYHTASVDVRPWSLLTYPWANGGPQVWQLFLTGWVIWWCGTDLERWWGSRVQAGFLLAVTIVTAGLLFGASRLVGNSGSDQGLITPLTALLTVWALRNPQRIIWLVIIPLPAWLLASLEALYQWSRFGPWLGLAALAGSAGLAAAYFYWGHHLHRLFAPRARQPRPRAARRNPGHLRDADTAPPPPPPPPTP